MARNVSIQKDVEYSLETYIDITPRLGENTGKYWWCVWPSSETIQQARNNNHLYCLDPWWNSSWAYLRDFNITNNNGSAALPAGYTVNITLDTTGAKFLDNCDDLRIVWGNSSSASQTEIDRINLTACNNNPTIIAVKVQADIPGSGVDRNYSVYYGNPSAVNPP